ELLGSTELPIRRDDPLDRISPVGRRRQLPEDPAEQGRFPWRKIPLLSPSLKCLAQLRNGSIDLAAGEVDLGEREAVGRIPLVAGDRFQSRLPRLVEVAQLPREVSEAIERFGVLRCEFTGSTVRVQSVLVPIEPGQHNSPSLEQLSVIAIELYGPIDGGERLLVTVS